MSQRAMHTSKKSARVRNVKRKRNPAEMSFEDSDAPPPEKEEVVPELPDTPEREVRSGGADEQAGEDASEKKTMEDAEKKPDAVAPASTSSEVAAEPEKKEEDAASQKSETPKSPKKVKEANSPEMKEGNNTPSQQNKGNETPSSQQPATPETDLGFDLEEFGDVILRRPSNALSVASTNTSSPNSPNRQPRIASPARPRQLSDDMTTTDDDRSLVFYRRRPQWEGVAAPAEPVSYDGEPLPAQAASVTRREESNSPPTSKAQTVQMDLSGSTSRSPASPNRGSSPQAGEEHVQAVSNLQDSNMPAPGGDEPSCILDPSLISQAKRVSFGPTDVVHHTRQSSAQASETASSAHSTPESSSTKVLVANSNQGPEVVPQPQPAQVKKTGVVMGQMAASSSGNVPPLSASTTSIGSTNASQSATQNVPTARAAQPNYGLYNEDEVLLEAKAMFREDQLMVAGGLLRGRISTERLLELKQQDSEVADILSRSAQVFQVRSTFEQIEQGRLIVRQRALEKAQAEARKNAQDQGSSWVSVPSMSVPELPEFSSPFAGTSAEPKAEEGLLEDASRGKKSVRRASNSKKTGYAAIFDDEDSDEYEDGGSLPPVLEDDQVLTEDCATPLSSTQSTGTLIGVDESACAMGREQEALLNGTGGQGGQEQQPLMQGQERGCFGAGQQQQGPAASSPIDQQKKQFGAAAAQRAAANGCAPCSKWKMLREYDDIYAAMRMDEIFQDPGVEDSRVYSFALEGLVDVDFFPLLSVLNEADLYATWIPSFMGLGLARSEVLERVSRTNFVVRLLLRLPFPFAWRKVVFRVRGFDCMTERDLPTRQAVMMLEPVGAKEEREILTRSPNYSASREKEYEGAV
ncbi:unnamed protein product, partial [Amoebophrya sp. A25]|eukprot:GSA25T00006783001.1